MNELQWLKGFRKFLIKNDILKTDAVMMEVNKRINFLEMKNEMQNM